MNWSPGILNHNTAHPNRQATQDTNTIHNQTLKAQLVIARKQQAREHIFGTQRTQTPSKHPTVKEVHTKFKEWRTSNMPPAQARYPISQTSIQQTPLIEMLIVLWSNHPTQKEQYAKKTYKVLTHSRSAVSASSWGAEHQCASARSSGPPGRPLGHADGL